MLQPALSGLLLRLLKVVFLQSYLAWKYKRELNITNPSSTSGFQASFTLAWKPGMRKDFRDLRFVDLRGNKVNYFLESIVDGVSCRIWLRLPASVSKLWMYYGNGGVQSLSNGSTVFDFWDDFNTIDTAKWTKVHGSSSASGSILTLESTTLNSILESVQTFAVNSIVEARAYHAQQNRSIIGFRSTSSEKASAWHGTVSGDSHYYDYRFTHNGTSGTWISDAVSRGGSTFYVYGVAHLAAGPKYYVNYVLRGTSSTNLPGNVSLPIHFYSENNKGPVKVDWVRIRKYAAAEPTISLGKRYINDIKIPKWENAIVASSQLGMTSSVSLKYFINVSSQLGMKPVTMFRYPKIFRTKNTGPYQDWKFKGDIQTPRSLSISTVNVLIRRFPSMTSDGRDLRFTTTAGQNLIYYIESLADDVFSVWVQIPEKTNRINFYYGNHFAVSESDSSIYTGPFSSGDFVPFVTQDGQGFETVNGDVLGFGVPLVERAFPSGQIGNFYQWKYKGIISIQNPDTQAVQVLVTIPKYPGMSSDGRDLRFSDISETSIPYCIDSINSTSINCFVKIPALASSIYYFYGNGTARSMSNPSSVFDFWDDFDILDGMKWFVAAGSARAENSTLRVSHATANSLVRSSSMFPENTILEIKCSHPYQNRNIFGYWSASNQRACWMGAHLTYNTDFCHTMDGTTQTNTNDSVERAGASFNVYGIEYIASGPKFYVNYEYRRQLTTTKPTGNLPIGLYSEANEGDLAVDWIRVRKSTSATAVVGWHRPRKQSVYYVEKRDAAERAVVERHYPQKYDAIPYYEYIAVKSQLGMGPSDPVLVTKRELRDYSLVSCDISKSISDAYTQLSAEFADLVVPKEGSTVKYYARPYGDFIPFSTQDGLGFECLNEDIFGFDAPNELLFHGKVITNTKTIGCLNSVLRMQAADKSRNLSIQKIPWNYQIVDGSVMSWPMWIKTLVDPEKTGVKINTILDITADPIQFAFDPKTSRMEAIQKIADHTNSIINIKIISRIENGLTVTGPEFFCVPPEYIDRKTNGFDLPDPVILTSTESLILDNPEIVPQQDDKYNKVIVYGTLSDTGETVVAAAYSQAVHTGREKANEYIITDNSITEKGSTVEREAIKWLLYFLTPRSTVNMKVVNMFDYALYQRIRFGSGFSPELQTLTNSPHISSVWACDPRDEAHSEHEIDVSGVPTPKWLRISEIRYHSAENEEICEVKAITDWIYSATDPVIASPYSEYLSPGYRKPSIDDPISTTQAIVDNAIEKQLQPELCTVLSKNEDNRTAVVQTASGKLVTIQLPY